MSIADSIIVGDNQIRVVAAGTVTGAAQDRRGCHDLLLTIQVGADGAAFAPGASAAPSIQGSGDGALWSDVPPHRGTLPANFTAVGYTHLHFAQLQFTYYRIQVVATGAPTMNVSAVWNFQSLRDSLDATIR